MELRSIAAALGRRRALLAVGLLVVAAVAALSAYRVSLLPFSLESREPPPAARVEQRVLIDTPQSQLAAVAPPGSETIATRAHLLGDLLATGEGRRSIAARAGIDPGELAVLAPGSQVAAATSPLAERAIEVSRPKAPNIVTMEADPAASALTIEVTGPREATATRVAAASVAALKELADAPAPIPSARVAVRDTGGARPLPPLNESARARTAVVALAGLLAWVLIVLGVDLALRRLSRPAATGASPRASSPSPS